MNWSHAISRYRVLERKLRPGTLPVHLIAGFGLAADLAKKNYKIRREKCEMFRETTLSMLAPLNPLVNGSESHVMSHVLNISFPGVDNEALMVALKNIIAISNGSACTSHSYTPSHVLQAMQLSEEVIKGTVRISWCHMTEQPDWENRENFEFFAVLMTFFLGIERRK